MIEVTITNIVSILIGFIFGVLIGAAVTYVEDRKELNVDWEKEKWSHR